MGSQGDINTKQKQEDRTQNILHIVIFLTLLWLIMIIIILGQFCLLIILILILLMLTIGIVWHTQRRSRISFEKINMQSRVNLDVINLPKVYDFYCPKCLYQTNEQVKLCPNCKIGILSPTIKNLER
jgi:fatty acid desaturase